MAIKQLKPQIRFLNEMRNVLYDKKWAKTAPNLEVYYMYRGVKEKNGLRYDLTIIPPQMLGREFPKTKGHKHRGNFPELIQLLEGEAFCFVQKGKEKSVEDCYGVKVKKNDFVIIPADYEHLTINPGKKKLKMANWISKKAGHDYSSFEKLQGACYYYTKRGWIKNKNYTKIPKLRFERPLKSKPKNLDFLK